MPAYCLSFLHVAISQSPLIAHWLSHGGSGSSGNGDRSCTLHFHACLCSLLTLHSFHPLYYSFLQRKKKTFRFVCAFAILYSPKYLFTCFFVSLSHISYLLFDVVSFCGIDGMCWVWEGIFSQISDDKIRWKEYRPESILPNERGALIYRKYQTRHHFRSLFVDLHFEHGRIGRQCTQAVIKMMAPSIGFWENMCVCVRGTEHAIILARASQSLCLSFAATNDVMYFVLCQAPTDRLTNPTKRYDCVVF